MEGDTMTLNLSGTDGKNLNALFIINGIRSSPSTLLVENLKLELPLDKFDSETASRILQDNGVIDNDTSRGLVCVQGQDKSETLSRLENVRLSVSDLQNTSDDSLLNASEIIMANDDQEAFTIAADTITQTAAPASSEVDVCNNQQVSTENGSSNVLQEHPKKKGGWPKGKKRKQATSETAAPRAPTTGYVLFQQERRQIIKKTNPEIPFAEVTKILGNEWSSLPSNEKQMYLKRAEEDKKRYREELKLYQQSEGYQTYQKWKKLKAISNENLNSSTDDSPSFTIHTIEEEDTNELYCKVCDILFSSIHNKKEHLYGRQHLQAVTGEIHKEAMEQSQVSEDELLFSNEDHHLSKTGTTGNIPNHSRLQNTNSTNVNQAIHDFFMLNITRLQEISVLKKKLVESKKKNEKLQRELHDCKVLEKKFQQELKVAKEYCTMLTSQLDSLRMVPALFGVINF
ncbi:high mobility group B protein 6-like [Centruroides sculpturatus]|uniref:high mobility group B protein 6-like n=1 Tax=Centruroides sculpturatus TaxID=218467 RepID=UPI000C6CCA53|nr:high mobility group B protein 6-like [Centruroides sculpturatus]